MELQVNFPPPILAGVYLEGGERLIIRRVVHKPEGTYFAVKYHGTKFLLKMSEVTINFEEEIARRNKKRTVRKYRTKRKIAV